MLDSPKRLGVIPARAQSTRFPYKITASIAGKPMIQHVWEAASRSTLLDELWVATDCDQIAELVRSFGGQAIMTPSSLPSGTDRVFYAVRGLQADTVVNLQGDEPLLEGEAIDALILGLESDASYGMATLAIPKEGNVDFQNPNIVKVCFSPEGKVQDFSRSGFGSGPGFYKHLGVYAFRKETLERFCQLEPSAREQHERLEQLRAMDHGIAIKAVVWSKDTVAVDVPEDIAKVEAVIVERRKGN